MVPPAGNEILAPNTPVLKIVMSILLSIFGSTGFRVLDFEMVVPRERISSGGFYVYSSKKVKHCLVFSHLPLNQQVQLAA